MSNLPLQPLVWIEANHPNGVYFEKTDSYIKDALCFCSTLVADYVIRKIGDRYVVTYGGRTENEYHTLEEAKEWCEFTHYPSKMQPYVKPMPTWIDVDERLPERKELLTDKDKCLVLTECGKVWTGFYNMHIKPDDWYLHGWTEKQGWHPFKIVAWMLASEFSTIQNPHKGDK